MTHRDPMDDIDEMDRIQLDFELREELVFPVDPIDDVDTDRIEADAEAPAGFEDLATDASLRLLDDELSDLEEFEP